MGVVAEWCSKPQIPHESTSLGPPELPIGISIGEIFHIVEFLSETDTSP
jgi:hypothetical protein